MIQKKAKDKGGVFMIKKVLIFTILLTIGIIIPKSVEASYINDEISIFVEEYSQVEPTWQDSKIKNGDILHSTSGEKIGYLFRVYQKNIQNGYIVYLDQSGIVEAKFIGEDRAKDIEGKVYYVFPSKFLTKKQVDDFELQDNDLYSSGYGWGYNVDSWYTNGVHYQYDKFTYDTYSITSNTVPDLSSNYDSYSTSMSGKYWVTDVPDYLNEAVPNGCVPTASAMLAAYYDNEKWNDLSTYEGDDYWVPFHTVRPKFPMSAEFDVSAGKYSSQAAKDLIFEMAIRMHTCHDGIAENCGTSIVNAANGLTDFFTENNHSEYDAVFSPVDYGTYTNEFFDYTALIIKGNPALLFLGAEIYGEQHVVLGVGFYSAYLSPDGFIIHDDLTHGQTWISQDFVHGFMFMYSGSPTSSELNELND